MPSFQGAVALLLASAVVWSSAQQLCHDQGTTCEDISVPDPAPGTMMMQVNRKVAAAAVSPVPLALNAGMTRVATAGGALQAVQLEESRSCVPMALQEIHLQSIRQYAAMLATGHKAQPLQKAPSASASPTKIESMKNDDDQGKQLVQIGEKLNSSRGKDAVASQSQACALPAGAAECSLITEGDATVGAKMIYTCLAVGGTLYDGSPLSSAVVNGPASYASLNGGATKWNFNGGATQEPLKFDWKQFSSLAQTAQSSQSGQYKVVVLTQGGSYDLFDFRPGGQGTDDGNTLVIFNTVEDVILTGTAQVGGRQFGPSVLAPFSKVTLQADAGYVDGCLFAKTFVSDGVQADSLQLHGKCYSGPLECGQTVPTGETTTGAPTTEPSATEAPVTAPAPAVIDEPAPAPGPAPGPGPAPFTCDGEGFKNATSLCCPQRMEDFFNGLLGCMGLQVCSKPHVQGLMHWFTCVPDMDFQYMLDVINDGNPCKYWSPIGQECPALPAQCEGKWCR